MTGRPLRIEFLPQLSARGGRLESATGRGAEVHAASYLRQRRMVLAAELLTRPRELRRILVHEVFHFVWLRAGNPRRRSYEELIAAEMKRRARGELGWSAELRKERLNAHDVKLRTRAWREYLCESFCDSAAWLFAAGRHPEHTLAARFQRSRREWFGIFAGSRVISM